jgi:hypothetical protein
MRYWCHIFYYRDIQTSSLQGSDRRFPACACPLNTHLKLMHPSPDSLSRHVLSDKRGSECGALA